MISISESVQENKAYLGGVCQRSDWRDVVAARLEGASFNPLNSGLHPETCSEQKKTCDYFVYVFTPLTRGVIDLVELMEDCHKYKERILFAALEYDFMDTPKGSERVYFTEEMKLSIEHIVAAVTKHGGHCFETLDEVVKFLNDRYIKERFCLTNQ